MDKGKAGTPRTITYIRANMGQLQREVERERERERDREKPDVDSERTCPACAGVRIPARLEFSARGVGRFEPFLKDPNRVENSWFGFLWLLLVFFLSFVFSFEQGSVSTQSGPVKAWIGSKGILFLWRCSLVFTCNRVPCSLFR